MLAACGGGSDNDSGNPVQTPKPNPVPVAPTTSCSAAGIARVEREHGRARRAC